ncbi:MAG: hypothetical protein HOW73_47565 [Polyangiaceae bacterium]|nr:hypothetical protein [Polyangiaceae bacterium]
MIDANARVRAPVYSTTELLRQYAPPLDNRRYAFVPKFGLYEWSADSDATADGYAVVRPDTSTIGAFLLVASTLRLGAVTPPVLAAGANNYAPTDIETAESVYQDASQNVTLTGLGSGYDGRLLTLFNVSAANTIALAHESASSSAVNRFTLPSGSTLTIPAGGAATFQYRGATARWLLRSKTF